VLTYFESPYTLLCLNPLGTFRDFLLGKLECRLFQSLPYPHHDVWNFCASRDRRAVVWEGTNIMTTFRTSSHFRTIFRLAIFCNFVVWSPVFVVPYSKIFGNSLWGFSVLNFFTVMSTIIYIETNSVFRRVL